MGSPLSHPVLARPGKQLKLFQAVMLACRFDIPTCLFLMPYLLHNVLAHGTDDARQSVQQEIQVRQGVGCSACTACVTCRTYLGGDATALWGQDLRSCEAGGLDEAGQVGARLRWRWLAGEVMRRDADLALRASCCAMQAVLAGASMSREGTLCCQAVFSLLDTLQKWHGDAKAAAQLEQQQLAVTDPGGLGAGHGPLLPVPQPPSLPWSFSRRPCASRVLWHCCWCA